MILGRAPLTLYHASANRVETVDPSRGKIRSDFGRGFYVTTSRKQAERFVRTAVRKTGKDLMAGFVNEYRVDSFAGLNIHEFASTDQEWLNCVCAHRTRSGVFGDVRAWERFDVLAGKVANDDTMTVINIYLADGYGPRGSRDAVTLAVSLLRPERLEDQLCLKTDRAAARLVFLGAEQVPVR
jgi:hypothetical protein